MLPSAAVRFPPESITSPPIRAKVLPSGTWSPTGRLLRSIEKSRLRTRLLPEPSTTMLPGFTPYCKPTGILTVNKGGSWGLMALNSLPSENLILLAVLPMKEPPTSKEALGPKIMPLGLIKKRLALPKLRIKPSMLETEFPVTRLIIFSMFKSFWKTTV